MPLLSDKVKLDAYIDDLILNPQEHEEDDPREVVGALIYGIETRENFDVMFNYYLKNISHTEKLQVKEIIKHASTHSGKPITDRQSDLFKKLIDALPKDKVAKKNEERRRLENIKKSEDDTEFLRNAEVNLGTLKRKLGDELKKENNKETCEALQDEIEALQLRVEHLTHHPALQKKAREVAEKVIDSQEQITRKVDYIRSLVISNETTPEELTKIQEKIATNGYAYNHRREIREPSREVLQSVRDLRARMLDPKNRKDTTILEALVVHKLWNDGSKFDDPKFKDFTAEHLKEGFYVMRPKRDPEIEEKDEKNDIKMHVSINSGDPDQVREAMEIIHELAQKYPDLIQEYKIGDIEHIQKRINANTKSMTEKLQGALSAIQGLDIQALIKELKIHYPFCDPIIDRLKAQLPQEKQYEAENILKQMVGNELGSIVSGERILNEALFTVYFKKDVSENSQQKIQEFSDELAKKLKEKGIRRGNTAKTDMSVNAYCGVTIDHVMDKNGNKMYLEGDNPVHVKRRRKALKDNPLTKDLIQKATSANDGLIPRHEAYLSKMSSHVDEKDELGMSPFAAQGLSEILIDDRIAFAGLLLSERFKKTKNVNLVYRNPDMFAKAVVKQILTELDFPVKSNEKKEFFQLVEKAVGGDSDSKAQLKAYFSNPDTNAKIAQMLAPFYHDYLESVKNEFDANYKQNNMLPKDEQKKEYYQKREERLEEAKKQFMGHISFPFVESLVFELQEKDGFSPERKAKLAQGFRTLREGGILNGLLTSLEQENQGYKPPQEIPETVTKAFQIFQNGRMDYVQLRQEHRKAMLPVEERATTLYKIVNKLASNYPKESELKVMFERIASSIENTKTELDHKLLRGEKITPQDIEHVQLLFDAMMKTVREAINNQNVRGDSLLHESIRSGNNDLTKALIIAGADPRIETTHYRRGLLGALKDAFSNKPGGFFKKLTTPPLRSSIDIAKVMGNTEILESLKSRALELNTESSKDSLTQKLDETLVKTSEKLLKISEKVGDDVQPEIEIQKGSEFHLQKTKSPFVQGCEKRISEQLLALKDGQFTPKQNNIACYALKQIQNYMINHPDVAPPKLSGLQTVIERVSYEASIPFPSDVKLLLREIGEGKLFALGHDVKEKVTGPRTDFVEQWQARIDRIMNDLKFDPKSQYLLTRVKNHLESNPGISPDKFNGLSEVLKQVEKEAGGKGEMKPIIKEVVELMSKGDLPPKEHKLQL